MMANKPPAIDDPLADRGFPDENPPLPVGGQGRSMGHPQGHTHGHSHGTNEHSAPASRRVRRVLVALTVPLLLANLIGLAWLWPNANNVKGSLSSPAGVPALIAATVVDLTLVGCTSEFDVDAGSVQCLNVDAKLRGGPSRGATTTFQQPLLAGTRLKVGDRIYLTDVGLRAGKPAYVFYEFQRERPLLLLLAVFVFASILIGRKAGLRALFALALSLVVLAKFILPAIVEGQNPLLVALVGASAVMFLALYLSHGINARTTSALLGTVASLGVTGLLAKLAVDAARFTGLSGEESSYLRATSEQIDLRGLLLAGIIIGALGVLDDVTITQASAVWELHQANPDLGFRGRYDAAIRIGRDHIASVVNTLVLAYAGAALPLLLLFTQAGTPLGELFNGEPVATEIVRMLAGSIGLMTAVPITTALTAFVVGIQTPPTQPTVIAKC